MNRTAKLTEEGCNMLREAQMHLETIQEGVCGDEADKRTWAAIYLIQAVVSGLKPASYDELLAEVRTIDTLRAAMS